MTSQLELTVHWTCLSLGQLQLSYSGDCWSARFTIWFQTCFEPKANGFHEGLSRDSFAITFQLCSFLKTFKQHNGCHAHEWIMDDEGRRSALFIGSAHQGHWTAFFFENYWQSTLTIHFKSRQGAYMANRNATWGSICSAPVMNRALH